MYKQSNEITCLKCTTKFIYFQWNCTYVSKDPKPLKNLAHVLVQF